jgi:hypothetical protein
MRPKGRRQSKRARRPKPEPTRRDVLKYLAFGLSVLTFLRAEQREAARDRERVPDRVSERLATRVREVEAVPVREIQAIIPREQAGLRGRPED